MFKARWSKPQVDGICHREERSDATIQESGSPYAPWVALPEPVRKDGRLSTPYGSQ
jgi:hypothetical protein